MDETETLGKYLRRERELKKISLRELSKNTRVREAILKAIEEDRHDLLPSPTFVKGFLTAYAKFIGLDANDVILRYQRLSKETPDTAKDVKPEEKSTEKKQPKWVRVGMVVAGVIVACLILSYFLFFQPSNLPSTPPLPKPEQKETSLPSPAPPQIAGTNLSEPAIPAPAPSPPQSAETSHSEKASSILTPPRSPTAESNPPQTVPVPKPLPSPPQGAGTNLPQKTQSLSLRLKTVETTWVNIKVDDRPEQDMMLRPGDALSFEAGRQIYILIGNAGGLDLIYNGKPLERFGKTGEVVALTLTPQGFDVKRFEKPKEP